MARLCSICRKPLGLRRERQGVRRHPQCRSALPREEVESAIEQAERVLSCMSTDDDNNDELSPLFRQAAQQASDVISDLKKMRGYLARDQGAGG